jgi:hypothetical protein
MYYSYSGVYPWSATTAGRQNNVKCEPVWLFTLSGPIPAGSTIVAAKITAPQKGKWNSSGGTIYHRIRAEKSASSTFSTTGSYYNSLDFTTNYVDWQPSMAQGTGYLHETPDFKDVIQEVIDAVGEVTKLLILSHDNGSTGQYCRLEYNASGGAQTAPWCELEITYQ